MTSEPARVVAAFDFDGTLTRRDTLLPFLVEVTGRARVGRALARDAARLVGMALGRSDRDAAKADFIARVLAGTSYQEVVEHGRAYAKRVVAHGLRPGTMERLQWHQREGHDVVIVSASLDAYLHDVARRLDVGTVLCTTLEVDAAGTVTGRLIGGNCRGPEKAARLRAHLDHERVSLWAYGDSSGDDELLAMADHAARVTRRGQLVETSSPSLR